MARDANPLNLKRLIVVRMVSLQVRLQDLATLTGRRLKEPPSSQRSPDRLPSSLRRPVKHLFNALAADATHRFADFAQAEPLGA